MRTSSASLPSEAERERADAPPLPFGAEFEQVEKNFRAALRPWIRRGVLGGRALGWERGDQGQIKLD